MTASHNKRWRPMWRDSFIDKQTFERRPPVRADSRSVVRFVTHHGGGGSYMCFRYPIRLPRISILETAHAA